MSAKKWCCGISTACFCCQLETLAFIVGFLGAVFRLIVIVAFGILLSMLADYDPNIYELLYGLMIGFSVVSFIASLLLLIGVLQRMHLLFLPYLSLELFEILLLILFSLIRVFLWYFLGNRANLNWFIPLIIIVLCFLIYSWIVMSNLYIQYSSQTYNLEEVNRSATITFQVATA